MVRFPARRVKDTVLPGSMQPSHAIESQNKSEPKATHGRAVAAFKASCPAGKPPLSSFLA
jgi:hypothetical protein